MRPIDFCHPNELCVPAPRAFPARARSFRCADAPRSLRLRQALPGDRTFHDVRDRFGGSSVNTDLERKCLTAFRHERGRFLPTVLNAIEPLAPLSRPSVPPSASSTFAEAALSPPVLLLRGFERVGGCEDRLDHR